MSLLPFKDHTSIVVGKPLPYSIYGTDRKLLHAKGVTVSDEALRNLIIKTGAFHAPADDSSAATELPLAASSPPPNPNALAQLAHRYANLELRSRFGLRIARDETAESYASFVVGVVNETRSLILAAPKDKNDTLVPIAKDEVWLCRLFNATTVFRFMAKVIKVANDPLPYLHIELPPNIEKRMVRKQPRALSALNATLHRQNGERAVIVDISVSGVRLAVSSTVNLAKNSVVQLFTAIPVLERSFRLSLTTKVSATFGAADSDYPDIHFYGLQFEDTNETASLVLNSYVHAQLTDELDRLSRILIVEEVAAGSVDARE